MNNTVTPRTYQWLKTDKAGEYSQEDKVIEEDGITYLVFTDGSMVNTELIGQYVVEVSEEGAGYLIEEEVINDIVTSVGKDGVTYEVPGPSHGKVVKKMTKKKVTNKPRIVAPIKETVGQVESTPELNPVRALLDKAKKETHIYDIQLTIKSIPESLYTVVAETFEDGEDLILDYIIEQLDMAKLKEQLRLAIKKQDYSIPPTNI